MGLIQVCHSVKLRAGTNLGNGSIFFQMTDQDSSDCTTFTEAVILVTINIRKMISQKGWILSSGPEGKGHLHIVTKRLTSLLTSSAVALVEGMPGVQHSVHSH